MGRGKSSAAIRYMNEQKGRQRFLYITLYLDEVDRICKQCDFDQPDSDHLTKSTELKNYLRNGYNVAATHSLFYLMDDEALGLIKEKNYSLIVDESISVIRQLHVSCQDTRILMDNLVNEKEGGQLEWRDPEYTGCFYGYKEMADVGSLYKLDTALFNILNPKLLRAFQEVYMLTYMFDGQYQKAYLDFFGFEYRVVGIEEDKKGFFFSDKPDNPPPTNYHELIHIIEGDKFNSVGEGRYALAKAWYERRGYNDPEIRKLRTCLRNFFRNNPEGTNDTRLWTCFKSDKEKLIDIKTGRFRYNFLQTTARATNRYKKCTDIAYMVNRFADPNIVKLFANQGIKIDPDKFALSEMLQWIWRSAIRDGNPINLYVPSNRMRRLLINWMKEN